MMFTYMNGCIFRNNLFFIFFFQQKCDMMFTDMNGCIFRDNLFFILSFNKSVTGCSHT